MKMIKHVALAGVLALGASTAAHAATTTGTPSSNGSYTLNFSWIDTAYSEESTQDIGFKFDLVLNSYTGVGKEQTGYYLDDAAGNRLTTDITNCRRANWMAAGRCNLIKGSTEDGTVLFSNLAAGSYSFGVYDSATPQVGTLSFAINNVAAVPLPAGGALLLGAMGAFAALRRRKKAA